MISNYKRLFWPSPLTEMSAVKRGTFASIAYLNKPLVYDMDDDYLNTNLWDVITILRPCFNISLVKPLRWIYDYIAQKQWICLHVHAGI